MFKELAQKYSDYTKKMRREFHMNPEPSMQEYETQKRVIQELESMGISCKAAGGTGVVGIIKGQKEGKTLALRADMDALELQEETNVSFRSKREGIMHACGHDGHTAALLTGAKILKDLQYEFQGTVKLLFQPGEETAQGALALIDDGLIDDIDGIFGLHLWNYLEVGKVSIEHGPRMASAARFIIRVKGAAGHGSMPDQGVDAGYVGASILINLQSIVSREISPLDPAVVSIGVFNSGTRFNVLPGEAHLEGTTRCFSLEVNDSLEGKIRRLVENTAKAYRAEAVLEYEQLTTPVINDPKLTNIAQKGLKDLLGEGRTAHVEPTTAGEDFSLYAQKVPAVFAFVGSQNKKKNLVFPHHHSKFNFDEESLNIAAGLYASFTINYLNNDEIW